MIKEEQNKFYAALGRVLTDARKHRNMTITDVVKLSGEQFKTIQSIEQGKPCSLHHIKWMREILGISFGTVIDESYLRGSSEKENRVDDFI